VNTLVALTADRQHELGLLKLLGATDRELMRMLSVETALVVTVGLVLGAAAGGISLVTFSNGVTGSPVPSLPRVRCLAIAVAAAVLAAPSILVTGRFVLARSERALVAPAAA
jgi:putative ABC transport system permease protein